MSPAESLESFREQFALDKAADRVQPLRVYLAQFEGVEEAIARAYVAHEMGGGEASDSGPIDKDRIGPYRIVRELGRGGQGIVFLAEDTRLQRRVALKALNLGMASAAQLDRFKREAEVASRLDHPGICTVLDSGVANGVPYIAMRHIEGETLAQRIAEARAGNGTTANSMYLSLGRASSDARPDEASPDAPPDVDTQPNPTSSSLTTPVTELSELVRLFEKAARALHAAHLAGVIHRDIKPGNIMITPEGEPVILDFGLAREEDDEAPSLTQSGDLFGTPSYMSPEQLVAQRIPLDARTDVWSLGVSLYESLTGERPFDGATRHAIYSAVLTKEPSSINRRGSPLQGDLRVVVATALEKDRDRRYQTALDFAEDLRRVRRFEPIKARPVSAGVRFRRWTQRHPAIATGVVGAFLLLAIGLTVALALLKKVGDARADEARQRGLAESRHRAAQDSLAAAFLEKAQRAVRDGDHSAGAVFAAAALVNDPNNPRGPHYAPAAPSSQTPEDVVAINERQARMHSLYFEAQAGRRVRFVRELPPARNATGGVVKAFSSMSLAPDGRRACGLSHFGQVVVWALEGEGEPAILQRDKAPPESTQWHDAPAWSEPDGRLLAAVTHGGVSIWETTTYHRVAELATEAKPRVVVWRPGEERLLVADARGRIREWELGRRRRTGFEIRTGDSSGVFAMSLSPSADRLAVATGYDNLSLWSMTTGKRLWCTTLTQTCTALAWTPDGKSIAGAGYDNFVWLLDPNSGDKRARIHTGDRPWSVVFSADSRLLLHGGIFETAGLREVYRDTALGTPRLENRLVDVLHAPAWALYSVALGRDDRTIVAMGKRGRPRIYHLEPPSVLKVRIPAYEQAWYYFALAPDGKRLVSVDIQGAFSLWRVPDDARATHITHTVAQEGPVDARADTITVSRDFKWMTTCTVGHRRDLWSLPDFRFVRTLTPNQGRPEEWLSEGSAFSPDSSEVLGALPDGRIGRWPVDGDAKPPLVGHEGMVTRIRFSHDGALMASCGVDKTVRIWRTKEDDAPVVLRAHTAPVSGLDFSPDDRYLVSSDRTGAIILWDVATHREVRRFVGHEAWVNNVRFSPDGELLLSACSDYTARLWDVETGELQQIFGCDQQAHTAEFTPDGRAFWVNDGLFLTRFAVVRRDRDADPTALLRAAEAYVGMRLSGLDLVDAAAK